MNKIILLVIITFIFYSCDSNSGNHEVQIKQMEDSVFANFATVNGVTIEVKSEMIYKVIFVTLRDKELYNASEANREKVVARTKNMIQNIFKETLPDKGEVIFVEEENTVHHTPGTEKKYPLEFPNK